MLLCPYDNKYNIFHTVTMAKGMGNGYPMGAVITTPEVRLFFQTDLVIE